MTEGLEIRRDGTTLIATVARGAENSFSNEMIDALQDAVVAASRDGSTRFARIRALGDVFCLGRERAATTVDGLREEAERIVRLNETLATVPLIVISEVNGDAAGFGCGIVASSDIAVASESARFWFPEITIGLAPTVVIGWASKLRPEKRTFDMVVTGEPIDAATAVAIGLVTETVPPDRVTERVAERIETMERLDAEAIRGVKRFFARVRTMDAATAAEASVDPLVLGALRLRPTE